MVSLSTASSPPSDCSLSGWFGRARERVRDRCCILSLSLLLNRFWADYSSHFSPSLFLNGSLILSQAKATVETEGRGVHCSVLIG